MRKLEHTQVRSQAIGGVLAALAMAACSSSSSDDLGVAHDLAVQMNEDLSASSQDLASSADLTGSIDAGARPWTAKSSSTNKTLYTVWGSGIGGTVWAAGQNGTVVKSVAGGAFMAETGLPGGLSSVTLFGLSGTSATSAYAVGASGTIIRLTNTTWATEAINPTTSSSLYGVWAGAGGVGFAAGTNSTLLYSTGTPPWTPKNGASHNVNGIWGSSVTDVYAVGQGNLVNSTGVILHYNGTGDFTAQTVPAAAHALFAVGGSGPTDVYVVGLGGVILHSTGNGTWTEQTSGTTENLNAVGGIAGEMYAVGDAGVVLISSDSGATWTAQNQGTTSWRGVWASAGGAYIVGDNGDIYFR